ncbi:MAG: von Willebrand factor type A domain-containing protein [Thermoguttaceae bacterium]|nr:von Willebrand factor type A domain-containing protein [Thermoguttaceae bacterium]
MSVPHNPSDRELREARWTAYALGQLEDAERESVADEAAVSAEARRFIGEIQALGPHVREALSREPLPAPSAALRRMVAERIADSQTVSRAAGLSRAEQRRWVYVVVATACMLYISVVAALLFPSRGKTNVAARPENAPQAAEQDARAPAGSLAAKDGQAVLPGGFAAEPDAATSPPSDAPAADGMGQRPVPLMTDQRLAGDLAGARRDTSAVVEGGGLAGSDRKSKLAEKPASDLSTAVPAAPVLEPSSAEWSSAPTSRPTTLSALAPPAPPTSGAMGASAGAGAMGGLGGGTFSATMPAHADATPYFPVQPGQEQAAASSAAAPARSEPRPNLPMPYGNQLGVLPAVPPAAEQYDPIVENSPVPVARQPVSTFSIDVDTASYANLRRFLTMGMLPPGDAVRIEEMINYFSYDYPPPREGEPFSINLEIAQCPWNAQHRLLRVGLKGREIDRHDRGPSNLVFLLDISGSMSDELPLVKQAMRLLVEQLAAEDRVAIVTYASETGVRLPSTRGEQKSQILAAIESLAPGGATNGSGGIQLAYQQATENFIANGTNRVIWATDGDLNVGITRDEELVRFIEEKATSGVFLTVLGFGTGNLKDSKLEKLADRGNGVYAYIDDLREARKVLIEQMTGSLMTIAKDVKLQIGFNPAEVAAYRLIGYENRLLAAPDFDDDRKDGGEIGAGHTATALYELIPPGASDAPDVADRKPKSLRDGEASPGAAAGRAVTATVSLRYKEPDGMYSRRLDFSVRDQGKRFGEASTDFQFAAAVGAFGMLLRGSQYRGDATSAAVEEYAASAVGNDPQGYRAEFVDLVRRARQLGLK